MPQRFRRLPARTQLRLNSAGKISSKLSPSYSANVSASESLWRRDSRNNQGESAIVYTEWLLFDSGLLMHFILGSLYFHLEHETEQILVTL